MGVVFSGLRHMDPHMSSEEENGKIISCVQAVTVPFHLGTSNCPFVQISSGICRMRISSQWYCGFRLIRASCHVGSSYEVSDHNIADKLGHNCRNWISSLDAFVTCDAPYCWPIGIEHHMSYKWIFSECFRIVCVDVLRGILRLDNIDCNWCSESARNRWLNGRSSYGLSVCIFDCTIHRSDHIYGCDARQYGQCSTHLIMIRRHLLRFLNRKVSIPSRCCLLSGTFRLKLYSRRFSTVYYWHYTNQCVPVIWQCDRMMHSTVCTYIVSLHSHDPAFRMHWL